MYNILMGCTFFKCGSCWKLQTEGLLCEECRNEFVTICYSGAFAAPDDLMSVQIRTCKKNPDFVKHKCSIIILLLIVYLVGLDG